MSPALPRAPRRRALVGLGLFWCLANGCLENFERVDAGAPAGTSEARGGAPPVPVVPLSGSAGVAGAESNTGGVSGAPPVKPPPPSLPIFFDTAEDLRRCRAQGMQQPAWLQDGKTDPRGSALLTKAPNSSEALFAVHLSEALSLEHKRVVVRARASGPMQVKLWASSSMDSGTWADSGLLPLRASWTDLVLSSSEVTYKDPGWNPKSVVEVGIWLKEGYVMVDAIWLEDVVEPPAGGAGGSASIP